MISFSTFAYADWQSTLEANFDVVETFDQLADWVGTGIMNVDDPDDMPTMIDESPSIWGYYSMWNNYPADQPWIGSHNESHHPGVNVWNPTGEASPKSLCIDIYGNEDDDSAYGPSRFGLLLDPGYDDFYIFYMVKIQKNEFPTSDAGGGTYVEGDPYAYYSSWKFGTMNIDCSSANCYSDPHLIPHIKRRSAELGLRVRHEMSDLGFAEFAEDENISLDPYFDDWIGVEWRMEQKATTVEISFWFYEKDGTAHAMAIGHVATYTAGSKLWNSFFFGGNNSGSYTWDETMQAPYYVDDFIVDDARIGPTYFSLIEQEDEPEPTTLKRCTMSRVNLGE